MQRIPEKMYHFARMVLTISTMRQSYQMVYKIGHKRKCLTSGPIQIVLACWHYYLWYNNYCTTLKGRGIKYPFELLQFLSFSISLQFLHGTGIIIKSVSNILHASIAHGN